MTDLAQAFKRSAPGSDLRRMHLGLITDGLMPLLNRLPEEFFSSSADGRVALIEKQIEPGSLRALAQEVFRSGTYASLASDLHALARSFAPCPLVTVQSATKLDPERREEIQRALTASHPSSLIVFQTKAELAGGLRIFADGVLVDQSWRGRLSALLSNIHQHLYV